MLNRESLELSENVLWSRCVWDEMLLGS